MLRVVGQLHNVDAVARIFAELSPTVSRKGSVNRVKAIQNADVIVARLGRWTTHTAADHAVAEREYLLPLAATIRQLAPELRQLDRSQCRVELYISTTREEEQGGFELPEELVIAAGLAGLRIGVSILVMLGDETAQDDVDFD